MQQDNTIWIVCDFAMPILSLAFLFLGFVALIPIRAKLLSAVISRAAPRNRGSEISYGREDFGYDWKLTGKSCAGQRILSP
jgi:hypothetical protein